MDKECIKPIQNTQDLAVTYSKAFAIICMVLAHAADDQPICDYIVMFHMPLFFFFSGYCFKDKYLTQPITFFQRKIKGIYFPYVKWGIIFILLHNIFLDLHIYDTIIGFHDKGQVRYTTQDIYTNIKECLFLSHQEQLLGGYWFLKPLFWGNIILYSLLAFKKYVLKDSKYSFLLYALLFVSSIVIGNKYKFILPYFNVSSQDLSASLLLLTGYLFSLHKVQLLNCQPLYSIFSIILLVSGANYWKMGMGGAFYDNLIIFPYLATSVFFTWFIYSFFKQNQFKINRLLSQILSYIGNHTLVILTWHFLSFKVVSLAIINYEQLPINRLAEFPVIKDYSTFGYVATYFIIGLILPLTINYLIVYFWKTKLKIC